jgi:hypothetical protein
MKRAARRNGTALLVLAPLAACGGHATSTNTAQDSIAALKTLRDRGVLTEPEYEAKVANLKDAGAMTPGAAAAAAGDGAAGLGDGSGLGGSAGAAVLGGGLDGAQGSVTGYPAGSSALAGDTRSHRAYRLDAVKSAQKSARRALPNPPAAEGDSRPVVATGAADNGKAQLSGFRKFLAEARAKQEAMARSAHDLAHKMLSHVSHANPAADPNAANPDGQVPQSDGSGLARSGQLSSADSGDFGAQGSEAPARR